MKRYAMKIYPIGRGRKVCRHIAISGNESLDRLCEVLLDSLRLNRTDHYSYVFYERPGNEQYDSVPSDQPSQSTEVSIETLHLTKEERFKLRFDSDIQWDFLFIVRVIENTEVYSAPSVLKVRGWLDEDVARG